MATFCECDSSHKNLGVKSCPIVVKTKKKDFFVSIMASDGTRNSILSTDFVGGVLPEAYILGKLNESDPTKRWFPTPDKYENVTPGMTDTKTEEFNSGRVERVQSGVRTFEGDIVNQDSTLASKILSFGCSDFGTFEVFIDNAIRGEVNDDKTELFPLKIEEGTLDARDIETVEGNSVQRIKVTYQFSNLVDESKFMVIPGASIETDLLKANGLLDGTTNVLSSPSITSTTMSANVTFNCFGTFGSISYIQGLDVVADWELLDGVTPVTIATITDLNNDGTQLDFVFTLTAATTLTLNYIGVPANATLQGFDIDSVDFTTP
ncbi:MAG: hypothetical protein COA36_16615 [Desulfotalea sp.]|nr:MAG: hypothetical protein COA36_16615 [Desulfotalea sp.]